MIYDWMLCLKLMTKRDVDMLTWMSICFWVYPGEREWIGVVPDGNSQLLQYTVPAWLSGHSTSLFWCWHPFTWFSLVQVRTLLKTQVIKHLCSHTWNISNSKYPHPPTPSPHPSQSKMDVLNASPRSTSGVKMQTRFENLKSKFAMPIQNEFLLQFLI